MIITVIDKEKITALSLPEKIMGQYSLYNPSLSDEQKIAEIEAIGGEWVLKAARKFRIAGQSESLLKSAKLLPQNSYILKDNSGKKFFVYSEPVTEDRQRFTKFLVKGDIDISIGRADGNDITYKNNLVSSSHAVLSLRGSKWYLKDAGSSNGTFVNERRITQTEIAYGDTVFIIGLKIIVGKNFIAVNNPDGKINLSAKLIRFVPQKIESNDDDNEYELRKTEYFYRSPRFKRDIETTTFKIDPPPQSPITEEMPWMLIMGSSMAMGMMSIVTLATAIATFNITSMVMGASMLIGTLLLPNITKRYEKKQKQKKEELRQRKYREYLYNIKSKINEESRLQAEILSENYITVEECENRILSVDRRLWNRSPDQSDFLRIRLGNGVCKLQAEIQSSERKFMLYEDTLEEELHTLCESPNMLRNIPITYSLKEDFISGIIGEAKKISELARGMIVQLVSLYSYDEVKLVFLYDDSMAPDMEFVKWLPHTWNDDKSFRFIATNASELKEVSAYFEREIDSRRNLNEHDMEKVSPYYVIFSMSKQLSSKAEMIKQILSKKENIRMSVVFVDEELKNLPKECSVIASVDENTGKLFDRKDISGEVINFNPDIKPLKDPMLISRMLSNIQLDTIDGNSKFPSLLTFLEMFGVGKVEHLNALARWKENDPTKTLETPVGIDAQGDTFNLDLHERFHGPHGLVAGMTGSGKSEFIITYILSLAVNYHPEEVAFILIDYKGGGMAKSFEKLPHTAGIITNLDGAAIKRSLISIESELKRRQAIFAQASKKVSMSNIDIYKYQKLYREGKVSEPLQHLFIISDEFAELKAQQPEFMTQLVSAARIGRSLGVHLILATQKPSGVVDDQIWSNSKFRICLKVQERADSMDMIKRPDAAELKDTGRFYLQVGYNELFEMGQSAWAGALYAPSDNVVSERDDSIVVIDRNGHPMKQVRPNKQSAMFANANKQLDEITDYLCNVANEEKIKIRPLWLEPIPAVIVLDMIKAKYQADNNDRFVLNPVVGEYDDPTRQQQCLLRLPISEEGNVVVYGVAGSGKTTFLNSMLYSLITEHTPEEVNLYILDFASETLRAFANAPHVGGVMLSYENEKILNLFKMLMRETEKRKKLFADYGGDYASYIKQSGNILPSIVVTIHNFTAFSEAYPDMEDIVVLLSREGTKYGIYFVLTSLGTNGVRFRLLQNFKQLIALQLNDTSDYSSIVGKTDGLYPSKFKGRGLVKKDMIYEFQTAVVTEDENPYMFIRKVCNSLRGEWDGETAKNVPVLPEVVDAEFIKDYIRNDAGDKLILPVGIEKNSMEICSYPFGASYITEVLSAGNDYVGFMSSFCEMIAKHVNVKAMIFDPSAEMKIDPSEGKTLYAGQSLCENGVNELFDIVLMRNNKYKEALERNEKPEKYDRLVVLVNCLSSLRNCLSEQGAEKLRLILERGSRDYQISIVFADQVKALNSFSFEKWYASHITQTDGIWVGNGISEQYQLKATKTTAEMRADIEDGFGFVLDNGRSIKVKLLRADAEGESYE